MALTINRKKQYDNDNDNEVKTNNPALHPCAVIKKDDSGKDVGYLVGLPNKKFFKLGETEYEILKLLNGQHSAASIREEFLKTKDVEIPIDTIECFIEEVISLGIASPSPGVKTRKSVDITIPGIFYKCFSLIFKPVILVGSLIIGLAAFVFFILNIRSIFGYLTPYYTWYFPVLFIVVYLVTSFLHEIGHGAAIWNFHYPPGPVQIKRGNGLFLFHFSTPFIVYDPDKPIDKKIKLTIIGGGMVVDWILMAGGTIVFLCTSTSSVPGAIGGILVLLTALARLLVSLNFFNENTDMAKLLSYNFENAVPGYKKHFLYKVLGTVFWLLQYSVFFYLIYIFLYPLRSVMMQP